MEKQRHNLGITTDLFDLSDEEKSMSEMMYEGKIIKCLVAPYHTYEELEKEIPYTKTTFLFPEREMSTSQLPQLISMIVANPNIQEAKIITANQNIILDMIDGCVRVLTEGGKIVPSPTKTFMANIHTIRYELLENEAHQLSKEEKTSGVSSVNQIISILNDYEGKTMEKAKYEILMSKIDIIGEDIIRKKLKQMAHSIIPE